MKNNTFYSLYMFSLLSYYLGVQFRVEMINRRHTGTHLIKSKDSEMKES